MAEPHDRANGRFIDAQCARSPRTRIASPTGATATGGGDAVTRVYPASDGLARNPAALSPAVVDASIDGTPKRVLGITREGTQGTPQFFRVPQIAVNAGQIGTAGFGHSWNKVPI